ncbi:MAG: signal peptidase I [Clostridium sp.]|nr:signal peptidase I [Clostridium sp.]
MNTNEPSINTTAEKSSNKKKDIISFFTPIVIAVVIASLLKFLVFANAVVPTGSMLNTIQMKDRVIASRLAYIKDDPERYDVIIFEYPDWQIDPNFPKDKKTYFVKRIVGLPGETVQVVEGIVYVTKTTGETIQLDDSFVTNDLPAVGDYGPYEVPADSYFVMGDNRNHSDDSRFWTNKYVQKDKILGKVLFKYYPGFSKIE